MKATRFTRRKTVAVGLSIGFHLIVLGILARLEGPRAIDIVITQTAVIWLGEWREPEPDKPSEPRAEPPTDARDSAPIATREARADPAPIPAATEEEPPADVESTAEPDLRTVDEAHSSEARVTEPTADIDYDGIKARAVAAIMTELERKSGRISFSTDVGDGVSDGARPAPGAIFDAPRSPRRRVMTPGQARTRVGRLAAELCNALTGGFGFFGIAMCSDDASYATFFAHLKPDYMLKRPVCEEPESLDPLMAEISRQNGIPTVRCRLVPADEVDALRAGATLR